MRVLTLFQGAGLADAGLSAAGCEHVLGVEWDEDAAEASRRNGLPCVTGDVRDLGLYADTGRIDLLWSSFPCQDFSTAGNRAGAKGERNGWPWTIEAVDHIRARGDGPRWLIAENVRGLTLHVGDCPTREGGEQDDPESCPRCYLDGVIVPQLRARFAWAAWRIIDSADHGVPQRRRRVYLVAGPGPIEWPERTHSGEALAKAKWDTGEHWRGFAGPVGKPSAQEQRWLDELRQPGLFRTARPAFGLRPWVTVRQALGLGGIMDASRIPAAHPTQERPTSTDEPCFAVGGKGNQYITAIGGPDTRAGTEPERLDRPAPTLGAGSQQSSNPNGRSIVSANQAIREAVLGEMGRRRLTVEECAALMSAPAGWVFHGNKSARYRQVGNGVTPPVAEALARAVITAEEKRR